MGAAGFYVDINIEPAYNGVVGILRMGAAGVSETSVNIFTFSPCVF
jgi:hypothetical protein